MKTTKLTFLLFLISFVFTTTFAQLDVKDGDDNILLQVNDYGDAGTLFLPSFGPILPGFPINNQMLYNIEGTLYWNGSALGTSSSAAGWTRPIIGGKIYPTDLTDNVGIGTNNPQSKLSVGGLGNSSAAISGEATTGWGLYGKATTGRGVYGSASGTGGRGVFGSANGTGGEGVIAEAHGQNGRAISGYANDASGHAGYFGGNVQINGSTQLGSSGTPFLEIREITGTTNTYKYYTAIDALPLGWTAANTRLVSLEIQGFSNNWYSNGYSLDGNPIAIQFYNTNRNITVYYPEYTDFHNKPWRAVIMRMP